MPARPWWRRRSVVITAGCLIAIITFGTRTSLGLFTAPLSDLRGWDRETFALAIAVQNLLWGLGQPLDGGIADRYGAGRVLAVGGALYALGTALMAVSTTGTALTLTGGVVAGLGLAGGSFTIVIAAFARLVPPDRRCGRWAWPRPPGRWGSSSSPRSARASSRPTAPRPPSCSSRASSRSSPSSPAR